MLTIIELYRDPFSDEMMSYFEPQTKSNWRLLFIFEFWTTRWNTSCQIWALRM